MSRGVRANILKVSGVSALTPHSPDREVLSAICEAAALVGNAYINDKALVYADVVSYCDDMDITLPYITEDLFFDRATWEIFQPERQAGREDLLQPSQGHGPGSVQGTDRNEGREQRRRSSSVTIERPNSLAKDSGEKLSETEPREGLEGSTRYDLF